MRLRAVILLAFIGATAPRLDARKKMIGPDNAIAIKQEAGSDRVGWAAVLIGRGVVAGPRYRQWNLVTVDTGPYRYQWEELKNGRRLVFTINEQFKFWRYGSLFLVVDSEGKTHKFGLVTAVKVRER
jgi:hypothetical protein